MTPWQLSRLPVVGAPMAGTGTPELAAAISNADGLGLLPAGYKSVEQLRDAIEATRQLTERPFGVNVFVPADLDEDRDGPALHRYAAALTALAVSLDVELPQPRWDDTDSFAAKIDLLEQDPVAVVSFVFGPPPAEVVSRLHAVGSQILATVTDGPEAQAADAAGADLLCLQGTEAGGHRGTHSVLKEPNDRGWRDLLPEIAAVTDLPVAVAGGIMTATDVTDALHRGAVAVQCGSAFLLTDESGMSDAYRAGFTDPDLGELVVTRAFSGRPARGVRNGFVSQFDPQSVPVFPVVDQLTKPLRAAAAATGNHELVSLWAGTGWRSARPGPAADVVAALTAELTRGA